MKINILILFLVYLIQPKTNLENKPKEYQKSKKDTIEFSPNWNFNGRCGGLCNVYVGGTNTVKKINGVALKEGEYVQLFVKCPSKIKLKQGNVYKFSVEKFVLNSCTTSIDTVANTKRFCLIEQVE